MNDDRNKMVRYGILDYKKIKMYYSLVVEKDEHSVLVAVEGKVSGNYTDREENEKLYECTNNSFKID